MSIMDKYVELPIKKLVSAQWNYKKDDDKKSLELMEKLKSNIARNGQIENLIIRKSTEGKGYFEVVNGNHRLKALKEMGIEKAVCFNLGSIPQAHAERIALETNETKFEADPVKLAGLIKHIAEEFNMEELVDTMPMSQEEIENYTNLLEFDWDEYEKKLDDVHDGNQNDGTTGTEDDGEWVDMNFRLPREVAELFEYELIRIKRALYPKRDPQDVHDLIAIECLTQHVAHIPIDMLAGD